MTDVVTSILTKDGKILLLKRGQRVSTYRGKWAGVSGYLEENETPLERAIREIEEETGLSREEIKLLKQGEIMEFVDENTGRTWRIHPFLFKIDREEIKIDWEHEEYRWIEREELKEYDTVPKLEDVIDSLMQP